MEVKPRFRKLEKESLFPEYRCPANRGNTDTIKDFIAGFQCHAIQYRSKSKSKPFRTDKVQNLRNERRYICKDPHQISSQRNNSYTRYSKKRFTQIYRDLYGNTMVVVPIRMSSNMADGNQQKHLLPSFATKA